MEQCEGCYTFIKAKDLGKIIESYCRLYYMVKNNFLKTCPCSLCLVKMICKDGCKDYLDTEKQYYDIDLADHLNVVVYGRINR